MELAKRIVINTFGSRAAIFCVSVNAINCFKILVTLYLSQRAFNAEFYEEDENEKPVFEDDLDDIG